MKTDGLGWWNLEENKNPEEGCFGGRADRSECDIQIQVPSQELLGRLCSLR